MMNLNTIKPLRGARRKRKRVGRGIAAGQGKTCGRGMKGQNARSKVRRGFEGGQMPLQRRLPQLRGMGKRAMNIGMFRKEFSVVNVGTLNAAFEDGAEVTPELLIEAGAIAKKRDGVKILGDGQITKKLTVKAHAFSRSARGKIEAAGGTAEAL